jgi:hypothetical protein
MRRLLVVLIILILFCFYVSYVTAEIHEVWPDPNGTPIKDKITDPGVKDGDIIIVHPGEYRGFGFGGKAITITSANPDDPNIRDKTKLSGENTRRVVAFKDGEGRGSVLRGFTIHDGYGSNGGGVYCKDSSPTIEKCLIKGNTSENSGGGIKCEDGAAPLIVRCEIINNQAPFGNGGGVFCSGSNPRIESCVIRFNEAEYFGGGIMCEASSPRIINCYIRENNAAAEAGGIYCDANSSPTIFFCDIVRNTSNSGCGGIAHTSEKGLFMEIRNSIVWANKKNEENNNISGDSFIITYSDIQWEGEGVYSGEGNISGLPKYDDPNTGTKERISPCIDTGLCDPNIVVDRFGNPRPLDGDYDGCVYGDTNVCSREYECDIGVHEFDFHTGEDEIIEAAKANIEKYRKADVTLLITEDGSPLADANVTIDQIEHEFLFGAQLGRPDFVRRYGCEEMREVFCTECYEPPPDSLFKKFRRRFFEFANYTFLPGLMPFKKPESDFEYSAIDYFYDNEIKSLHDHGVKITLHNFFKLGWGAPDPDCLKLQWIKDLNDSNYKEGKISSHVDEFEAILKARIERYTHYKGIFDYFIVVNEPTLRRKLENSMIENCFKKYEDTNIYKDPNIFIDPNIYKDPNIGRAHFVYELYEIARKANMGAKLIISDWNEHALYGFLKNFEKAYKNDKNDKTFSEDKSEGKRLSDLIDVIGIQSHQRTTFWPIEQLWHPDPDKKGICEMFADFNIPLHFTEVTVYSGIPLYGKIDHNDKNNCIKPGLKTDPNGERMQAEYMKNFYTALFGHPSVEAITWWDFSDKWGWKLSLDKCKETDGNSWDLKCPWGLLRKDMTPKPVYYSLLELIKGEWWTAGVKRKTGPDGTCKFNGFYGDYRFTVTKDGEKRIFHGKIRRRDGKEKSIPLEW